MNWIDAIDWIQSFDLWKLAGHITLCCMRAPFETWKAQASRLRCITLILTVVLSAAAQPTPATAVSVSKTSCAMEPAASGGHEWQDRSVESSEPTSIDEQRAHALRHLGDRLSYWKTQLQLDDWNVSVGLIRRADLRAKTLGKIRWDKRRKTAAIEVVDPADYKLAFRPMLADMEFTIVHELVHLELAGLPRSEASRSQEEHAVNRIAESLIRLDSRR